MTTVEAISLSVNINGPKTELTDVLQIADKLLKWDKDQVVLDLGNFYIPSDVTYLKLYKDLSRKDQIEISIVDLLSYIKDKNL